MTVAVAPPRLLTVAKWAARWHVSEGKAEEFLRDFERVGLAVRRGKFWSATDKAWRLGL